MMKTKTQTRSRTEIVSHSRAAIAEYSCYVLAILVMVFLALQLEHLGLNQKELFFGLLLILVLGVQVIAIGGMFSLTRRVASRPRKS